MRSDLPRYQEQLIRNSLYDLEGRFWYARDLLARGLFQPFEGIRAVFVDGFTRFTRTQHEILETLAGRVGELWIALPDEPGEIRSELFAQPRTTLQKLELLNPQVERLPPAIDRPAGLAHLERQLFRPLRTVERSENADGLYLIEAPGMIGETRLVAREIKQLLLDGVPARDILVTQRDVQPYADLAPKSSRNMAFRWTSRGPSRCCEILPSPRCCALYVCRKTIGPSQE